ncbi:hypothetical protein Q0F98_20845 [Paenibacillus amylolyticus]|nr:hypothetical protein Q0F98_20845 [Paenibacillus amylolyticus]
MNKAQGSQAVAMEAAAEGQAGSVTSWKFNFGPDSGRADETGDYLKVTATTAYEER